MEMDFKQIAVMLIGMLLVITFAGATQVKSVQAVDSCNVGTGVDTFNWCIEQGGNCDSCGLACADACEKSTVQCSWNGNEQLACAVGCLGAKTLCEAEEEGDGD